ncbi:MAG: PilZ domain-containing protein [Deltaproteobacteria bacterium]|nr:PilZ domain-containing protein [Deltaproteobacteria bacterium]
MASSKNEKKERPLSSIEQIEKLKLPRRGEVRRVAYLGEKIVCQLKTSSLRISGTVVDLSNFGFSLVLPPKDIALLPKRGDAVELIFPKKPSKGFGFNGKVASVSSVVFQKKYYVHIGIRYDLQLLNSAEAFRKVIGKTIFLCHPFIRPQVCYRDPFFFNETVVCLVNGFASDGFELIRASHTKTFFPQQTHEFELYLPGRGIFFVPAVNTPLLYRPSEENVANYMRYLSPSKEFLEAASEYLITFNREATPKSLREAGFNVGPLSHALTVDYQKIPTDAVQKFELRPAAIAIPAGKEPVFQIPDNARSITCRLGDNIAAITGVVFPDQTVKTSLVYSLGHAPSAPIQAGGHTELVSFFLSPQARLADVFIPLIKHVIRITYQDGRKFLVVETSDEMLEILKVLGFHETSRREREAPGGKRELTLMALDVEKVIKNPQKFLPPRLWTKIYKELSQFLEASHSVQDN